MILRILLLPPRVAFAACCVVVIIAAYPVLFVLGREPSERKS